MEFIRTLVYGLDLWFYPNAVLLWLSMLLQDLPLFINCDRQAVLCSMFIFLFCNCFVPFVPLISSRNCTLFFSGFVNFIFSNFKTILLCLDVIPLLSFNNSVIANLQQILNFQHLSFTHTYTDEGIQFRNISVWKNII